MQAINNSLAGSPWHSEQSFTVTNGPPVIAPRVLGLISQSGNTWLLEFSGTPATVYVLEGSSNLVNWVGITNLTASANRLWFSTKRRRLPTKFGKIVFPISYRTLIAFEATTEWPTGAALFKTEFH